MKKRTVLSVLSLFFLFSTAFANKDTGKITGVVVDANSQPLSFANILLLDTVGSSLVKAEYSGEDGTFELTSIPEGTYRLSVTYVGLPDYNSEAFSVGTGETKELPVISMQSASIDLAEVTVKAKRPLVEVHAGKTVFNVDGSINATGSDAMELLRKAPGLVVDNNDNIIMNGKNGVKVYIDGRPSQLSTSDLAAYLKTIQASDIDNIEIITNPPAKYDAEGNAGIINIRMKKDKNLGTNGTVNTGYALGRDNSYNGSLSGNHRSKTNNTFGSYNYSDGRNVEYFDLFREQSGKFFNQTNRNNNQYQAHNFKLGSDFFLNKFNTLGFLVNGYNSSYNSSTNSHTPISQIGSGVTDSTLIASSFNEGSRANYNFNLNYRFDDTKGTVWNFDADYGLYRNDGSEDQPNAYWTGTGQEGSVLLGEANYATDSPTDIGILTFKVDHERPFLQGQLSTGAKVSKVKTDNIFDFYNVIEGTPEIDIDRTNRFVYDENVNAVYANYSRQLGKFGFQAGLRVEQTDSKGVLTALKPIGDDPVKQDYVDFFPSGGVTYALNENNNFQLTYSRRVDRPSYQDLNPFEARLDELTYEKGNPFLNPQYTHSVQLNHTFKYRYNTSLSYSSTTDLITRLVDQDASDSDASFITWENLASQNNMTLTISAPLQLAEWWNAFANVSAYRTHNEADFGDGKTVDLNVYTFNAYMQQTFTLPLDLALEISGWYLSPSIWGGTFEMDGMGSVDAGLQKKFMKGNGTLKLSVSDLFHTQDWSGISRYGGLILDARGSQDSRRLRVNFTYRFGNQQVKSARNRSTGIEDEAQRIKEGN
jgi:iron complex outermembrane recepter protein